jgi:formiminotetrahydrofolate cyclodeaminase
LAKKKLKTRVCLKDAGVNSSYNMKINLKEIEEELNITPILDKIQDYRRNWVQCVKGMPRNR